MKRLLHYLLLGLMAGVLGVTALLGWLLLTEAGLHWSFARLDRLAGVEARAERLEGRLIGPVTASGLRLTAPDWRLAVEQLDLDLRPRQLLVGALRVEQLHADGVVLQVDSPEPETEPPAPTPERDGPGIRLPLLSAVQVPDLQLTQVFVQYGEAPPLEIERLQLAASLRGSWLVLDRLAASGPWGRLGAAGRSGLQAGQPVALSVDWHLLPEALRPNELRGDARLAGTVERPVVEMRLTLPIDLRLDGELQWLTQPLHWQAEGVLAPLDLSAIDPGWPALEVGGRIVAAGGVERFDIDLDGRLAHPEIGTWDTAFTLRRDGALWQLPALTLDEVAGRGRLQATAAVSLTGSEPEAHGTLHWEHLELPAEWRSPSGTLQASGWLGDYTFAGELTAQGEPLGEGRLRFAGQGDETGLRVQRFSSDALAAEWSGRGQITWTPALRWAVRLDGTGIDPAVIGGWPGQLALFAEASGVPVDGAQRIRIAIPELSGTLQEQPITGSAALVLQGGELALEQLTVASGENTLLASGRVAEAWDLRWDARLPRLDALDPVWAGSLQGAGRVRGPRAAPRIEARLQGRQLALADHRVTDLEAQLDLDLTERRPSRVEVSAGGLEIGVAVEHLALSARGTPTEHIAELRVAEQATAVALMAEGGYAAGRWSGVVRDAVFRIPEQPDWTQTAPAALSVDAAQIELAPLCLAADGAHLCAEAATVADGIGFELTLQRLPLTLVAPWLPRAELELAGALDGRVRGWWQEGLARLDAWLLSENGRAAYLLDGETPLETRYRRAELTLQVNDQATSADARVLLTTGGRWQARLRLPEWRPDRPLVAEQPLQGSAQAELNELGWLGLLFPQLLEPQGVLQGNLQLGGSVGAPELNGRAMLDRGSVALPALGITLESLQLTGELEGERLVLGGSAESGPGRVELAGSAQFTDRQAWSLRMSINGSRFEATRLPLARVLATPDLTLIVEPGRASLTGRVTIPEATINLPEFSPTVSPSPDVVIIGDEQDDDVGWEFRSEVVVIAGERVRVEGYGFSGRLAGQLRVRQPAVGPATATGTLLIEEGAYEAYGQRLEVIQGRLLFIGGPLSDPAIDARAVRRVNEMVAGIEVTGQLQEPVLRLWSSPPLGETEILSMLILGRPLGDATRDEAGLLQQAAVSLGLLGGGRIAEDIGRRFGIDEVRLETEQDAEEASLILGTYLSPRLYLQYAVGFWEAVNVLRIRYRLGQRWVLEAEDRGEHSGADLLFQLEN